MDETWIQKLRRRGWVKDVADGGLPEIPRRASLPTASADYRFRMVAIPGGTGVADVVYVCLKDNAEAYAWEVAATG